MDKSYKSGPFRPLGTQLKALRERAQETLPEASGAVEIDVKQLASFELGQARPSEDILLLLISHFGAKDEEALRLWELAGYTNEKIPVVHLTNTEPNRHLAVSAYPETRIMFTDIVDVIVNNYGVVVNFMQNNGPGGKPDIVARVGMSREHAKSVLQILHLTLERTAQPRRRIPKKLNAPESSTSDDKPVT